MDSYKLTFTFIKNLDKSIMVKKKTKKINKVFFIPKSLISSQEKYIQNKSICSDLAYSRERITLELPKWYVKKELGFYK